MKRWLMIAGVIAALNLAMVGIVAAQSAEHALSPSASDVQTAQLGVGLALGSSIGPVVQISLSAAQGVECLVQGFYGAGIAQWGLGNEWHASIDFRTTVGTAGSHSRFLLGPGIGYGVMAAEENRNAWIRFSPIERVTFVTATLSGSWIRSYHGWDLEVSLRPGVSRGLTGGKDLSGDAVGVSSFVLIAGGLIRF